MSEIKAPSAKVPFNGYFDETFKKAVLEATNEYNQRRRTQGLKGILSPSSHIQQLVLKASPAIKKKKNQLDKERQS